MSNFMRSSWRTGALLLCGTAGVSGSQMMAQMIAQNVTQNVTQPATPIIALVDAPDAPGVLRIPSVSMSTASVGIAGAGSATAAVAGPVSAMTGLSPDWEPKFKRWVDLNEMDFSMRYRSVADSNGSHEFNQGQQRAIVDGRVKFDEAGKYGVVFHATTGKYFNWAYADFIGGGNKEAYAEELLKMTPTQSVFFVGAQEGNPTVTEQSGRSGGWSFYVRRLYLDVNPVKWLNAQYGSLDIDRGAGSEITTYDNDGYIDGERITIKKPSWFYADEISATWAFIGDLYTPNFFARGERLRQSNYHQFLVRKSLWKKRIDASGDYTWQYKTQTSREAIGLHLPEMKIADSVRFEGYQRFNVIDFPGTVLPIARENGWAFSLDKRFGKRGRLEYGYADIDPQYVIYTDVGIAAILGLASNGDAYGIGKRYYLRPTVNLTKSLAMTGYYTHSFDTSVPNFVEYWNKQALNVGFVWDIKKQIFRDGK